VGSFYILCRVYEFGSLLLFKYLLILAHKCLFYYHVNPFMLNVDHIRQTVCGFKRQSCLKLSPKTGSHLNICPFQSDLGIQFWHNSVKHVKSKPHAINCICYTFTIIYFIIINTTKSYH